MKRRGTCTFTVSVLHLHASPSCGRFRETATATPTASATVSPGFEEALGSDAGPRGLTHRTGAAWVQGRATRGSTEAPSSVCPPAQGPSACNLAEWWDRLEFASADQHLGGRVGSGLTRPQSRLHGGRRCDGH